MVVASFVYCVESQQTLKFIQHEWEEPESDSLLVSFLVSVVGLLSSPCQLVPSVVEKVIVNNGRQMKIVLQSQN